MAVEHRVEHDGVDAPPVAVRPRRARPRTPFWAQVTGNVVMALVVVSLVQAFVLRVHNVSSGSMEETLAVTDRVLSTRVPYWGGGGPDRGDIVIFRHGDTWEDERRTPASDPLVVAARLFGDVTGIGISNTHYTVKRVVGLPGETVACCDSEGRVLVDGRALDEPYVHEDLPFTAGALDCRSDRTSARCFGPLTVPEGHYLVLGDHRSNSSDSVAACRGAAPASASACARFVPAERVTGKVVAKAWPPGPVG